VATLDSKLARVRARGEAMLKRHANT